MLVDARDVPASERGELFPVFKNAAEDRIVFNRIPRNTVERHIGGFSKLAPAGSELTELELPDGAALRVWGEDLSDFYPAFQASEDRGRTNALGLPLPPALFAGTSAYRILERECAKAGRPLPRRVLPCNRGLVMGDLNANDYAAQAHMQLLATGGSFKVGRRVLNQRPFPRGPLIEGVVVDDHFGIAVDVRGSEAAARAMQRSFDRGRSAYTRVGLRVSEKKAKHGVTNGVVVGAELLGDVGQVGAERGKRFALSILSMRLAAKGLTTGGLLRSVVSTWLHALLFRRPMLSVLFALFRALPAVADDNRVFRLPCRARDELGILSVLSPLMCTNLRAGWSDRITATDASPFGEGAVASPVDEALLREAWRRRERRGHYTWLYGREAECLRAAGRDVEADDVDAVADPMDGPQRPFLERYDYLELCCGASAPLCAAMAAVGLVVGPRMDIRINPFWDLTADRTIQWVLHLINSGRVWYVHCGVPRATFSVTRHPARRSGARPWGFTPEDPATATDNLLLRVALCVLLAMRRRGWGHASHVHPATAFSWKVKFWDWFGGLPDCGFLDLHVRAFGAPRFKALRMGRVRSPFLDALEGHWEEKLNHSNLGSSRTTQASVYPADLCARWAAAVAEARRMDYVVDDWAAAEAPQRRGHYEKIWLNELDRFLKWTVVHQRRTPPRDHINVKEIRASLDQMAREGRRMPSCRHLSLLDSRVSIGALAKGRSASAALNAPMRAALPNVLGFDVYPGYDFIPTRLNFSDDPSRLVDLRPGGLGPRPGWLDPLLDGDCGPFDAVADLPLQTRAASEWARFAVRLVSGLGGWLRDLTEEGIEPNPGPRPQALPVEARAGISLLGDRGLTSGVRLRRGRLLREFGLWLAAAGGGPLAQLLDAPARVVGRTLALYGQALFDAGRARGDFSETINAVIDAGRHLRHHLGEAWDVSFAWKAITPQANHQAMPDAVMRALVSLSLIWGWFELAGLIAIGFLGMMRPSDILNILGSDVLLPSQLQSAVPLLFVRIGRPKMRRLGARREHIRIDDPEIAAFFEALMRDRPRAARLYPHGAPTLRAQFGQLLAFFGIPHRDGTGLTLASLRPGGATFWYAHTDATEWVRFRGRWASSRMLEIYIQEVNAHSIMPALAPAVADRIRRFAAAAPDLLQLYTDFLVSGTPLTTSHF